MKNDKPQMPIFEIDQQIIWNLVYAVKAVLAGYVNYKHSGSLSS